MPAYITEINKKLSSYLKNIKKDILIKIENLKILCLYLTDEI